MSYTAFNNMLLYIESQVLCIVFLVVLFIFNFKYWKPKVWNTLSMLYLVTIALAFWDIIWILVDGRPRLIWLGHLADILHIGCIGVMGYLWFVYATEGDEFHMPKSQLAYRLYAIPLVIVTLLVVTSPITGWVYYIDANGYYHRGPLFAFHFIGYAYMLVSSLLALRCAKRAEYARDRKKLLTLALFSVPPVFLCVLQYMLPRGGLVVAPYAVLLSLLVIFVDDQHRKILVDNLTGLSNRYGLDVALHDRLATSKKDGKEKFCVILGDLDSFKIVNDTFGHPEGDRALKLTSDVLHKVAKQYNADAYRMGGDEFIILTPTADPAIAEKIYETVEQLLEDVDFRDDFPLSMSMGIVVYDGRMSAAELLAAVDKKLYDKKRKSIFPIS